MLRHKQIAVIGGDQRYVHMIECLAKEDAKVYATGFSQVSFKNTSVHKCTIDDIPFHRLNAVILPVHGMSETYTVDTYFPPNNITLSKKTLSQIPENCFIFSGTAKDFLRQLCKDINRKLIILYELEHVAILNALPTAEATLQLAMQHTARTIHGQTVLITGFGRVAQATAQLFQAVGANVHIAARHEADLATAKIRGMTAIPLNRLGDIIKTINICINTVPHFILTADLISLMDQDTVIIDVASKPGGTDFTSAKMLGVQAIHALGLPGKTSPITAGEIICEPIIKSLLE